MKILNILKHIFNYIFPIYIAVILFCSLSDSNFAFQDTENPCFFCHADLFFEAKDGTHEQNGIDCIACHGKSEEHTFAEDNRIKPDKIYKRSDIDEFCGNCHNNELEDYQKSSHKKEVNEKNENAPTCSTCHEGHNFEKKINQNTCLKCHGSGYEKENSVRSICEMEIMLYQVHSLKKIKDN